MVKFLTEISRITAAVRTTDISDHNAYKCLLNDCYALERHHMDFYSQIQRNVDGEPPTYSRGELKTGIRSTDDLFGPAYRFSSLEDAMLHLFFWVSLSSVYPLIYQCRIHAMADIPDSFQNDGDETHRLLKFYVNKAARCLPYSGQKGMTSFAYYLILCAVQISRVYTHDRDWERFLWAQDIFTFIELSGFEYAARYREIWWDYWFDSQRQDFWSILNYRQLTSKPKKAVYAVKRDNLSDMAME